MSVLERFMWFTGGMVFGMIAILVWGLFMSMRDSEQALSIPDKLEEFDA